MEFTGGMNISLSTIGLDKQIHSGNVGIEDENYKNDGQSASQYSGCCEKGVGFEGTLCESHVQYLVAMGNHE